MALWDTAGQEDYERLRPLSYNQVSYKILNVNIVSFTYRYVKPLGERAWNCKILKLRPSICRSVLQNLPIFLYWKRNQNNSNFKHVDEAKNVCQDRGKWKAVA